MLQSLLASYNVVVAAAAAAEAAAEAEEAVKVQQCTVRLPLRGICWALSPKPR